MKFSTLAGLISPFPPWPHAWPHLFAKAYQWWDWRTKRLKFFFLFQKRANKLKTRSDELFFLFFFDVFLGEEGGDWFERFRCAKTFARARRIRTAAPIEVCMYVANGKIQFNKWRHFRSPVKPRPLRMKKDSRWGFSDLTPGKLGFFCRFYRAASYPIRVIQFVSSRVNTCIDRAFFLSFFLSPASCK